MTDNLKHVSQLKKDFRLPYLELQITIEFPQFLLSYHIVNFSINSQTFTELSKKSFLYLRKAHIYLFNTERNHTVKIKWRYKVVVEILNATVGHRIALTFTCIPTRNKKILIQFFGSINSGNLFSW